MEVFCWNPAVPAEPLEAFNQRLEDFALANPVLDVVPTVAAGVLTISLTEAVDADLPSAACLIPCVQAIPVAQKATLETILGAWREAMLERDTDDNPYIPFRITTHEAGDFILAVALVGGGELEIENGPGDVDDENSGAIPPGGKR